MPLSANNRLLKATLLLSVAAWSVRSAAAGASYSLGYGGRATDAKGAPIAGPVDLKVSFYRTATGGEPIVATVLDFPATPLTQGVFQITMALPAAEFAAVFSDVSQPVFIQVTDTTHSVTYPRQQFLMVPFAAKVPVDSATITYDAAGQLTLTNPPGTTANSLVQLDSSSRLPAVDGSQLTGVMATGFTGKLTGDVSGGQASTTVTRIQGQPVAAVGATSGQVLTWTGGQWAPATPAAGSGSPSSGPVNLSQAGAVTGTLAVANGGTGSGTTLNNNSLMISSGGAIVEAPALGNGQFFIGSAGTAPVAATLSQGTTQGVTVTTGAGSLTLDTVQDIRTSATPQFSGLTLSNPAVGSVVKVGTGGTLVAAAPADIKATLGYTPVNKAGDAMTGSLGIGTTSATTTLDIAGALTARGIAPPAVAAAGQGRLYFDSTANQFLVSQNGGAYAPLLSGGTITGVTPGAGMTGGGSSGNVTVGLTNVGTAGTYTKVLTDANGRVTSGTTLTAADLPPIAATDITSGTLSPSVIPALPASQITSGTLGLAQIPALPASQITSGTLGLAQIPALPASQITSGTLADAQLPSIGTPGTYPKVVSDAYGRVTSGAALVAGDIPALPASQITSGTFAVAQLPQIPSTLITGTLSTSQLPGLSGGSINTGTLAVAFGGTGATSFTNNGLVVGGGSGPLSTIAAGNPYNILTVNASNQPVFGALNLGSTAAVSGTLPVASGGTGSGTALSNNRLMLSAGGAIVEAPALGNGQLFIGSAGNAPAAATLAQGTTQGVTFTTGAGSLTLDTVQDIRTSATPLFSGLTLANPAVGSVVKVGTGGTLVAAAAADVTNALGYAPVNKAGDTMTGPLSLGGFDLLNVGNIDMAPSKTLSMGTFTTDPSGLGTADVGKTWFNTTSNQLKYWDGSTSQALGVSGAGLTSLNGQSGSTQTFGVPGVSGLSPAWSSASNTHTLNIPLASAASVTAGLLSNTDYQTFTGKVSKSGDTMTGSLGIGTTSAETTLDIAGALTERASSAPAVAPVGQGRLYFDSTANQFMVSQNGGAYTALASGGTITGVTSGAGITGGGTSGNVTVGLTNVGTAGTYTKVLTDANGRVTSGTTLTAADLPPIAATDITSGTLSPSVIPALPASQITSGTLGLAQIPALPASQITSGTLGLAQIPALPASQITSGTLAAAQLPSIGTPGTYPKVVTDAYGRVTSGTALVAGDIPSLPASQITSGTFAVAQIPQIPSTLITGTLSTSQLPGLSGGSINTGTLAVAFGGTGATSFTNNGLVVGGGSSPLSTIAAGSQYNILTVNASNQPVFGALNLGSTAAVSGTLPVASGGTGSTTALSNNRLMVSSGGTIVEAPALTNGQLFVGSTGAAPAAATLAQGATQGVTFTAGAGSLTLDTAQDIRTSATPLFSSLKLSNPAAGSVVKVGTGGTLVAAATADVTTALGYTPVNKAGDTMTGPLSLGGFDLLNVGNIDMAPSKTLAMGTFTTDPSGLGTADVGKTWFNTTSNQLKYWDGSTSQALGVSGAGLTSLNGQSGSTQTFGMPGVSGLSPSWNSASNTHTLNIPLASAASVTAGLLSNTDYQTFTGKVSKSGDTMTGSLGIGTTSAETTLDIAGALTERASSAPAVAPVGQGRLYFDSTANQFMVSQNGGAYTAMASGGTITGVTPGTGITGGGTSGNVTVGLTNVGTAGTYTKVLTDANGRVTSGTTLTAADIPPISATDITSGTLSSSVVPALPASQITSGTLGLAQIPALPASQITSGTLGLAQIPALPASQITSGTLGLAQIPALPASQITSGTLAAAQLPSIGTPGTYPKVVTDAYGRVTSGTALVAGDIPALPASQITSGTFAVAQIPQIPSTLITGTLSTSQLPGLSGGSINTGTLAVAFGGTGATSFTNNGLVVGGGSSPLSTIAAGTQYNILTVNASNQPVFGALNLGSAAAVSGTLLVASGGTGSSTALSNNRLMLSAGGAIVEAPALTNGQLFVGSTGAAPTAATLAQGATQGVTFTAGAGSLTLDTAQDIRTSATPLFSSLKLSNPAAGSLVKVGTGSTLVAAAAADVTTALGYTPVNKAGDTMTGPLSHGGFDLLNVGNIDMAPSKTLAMGTFTTDPSGLSTSDVGKTWFNTSSNQLKYWDGSTSQALGVSGAGLTSLNGQSGSTQTFGMPGVSGLSPSWNSASNTHTLNIPLASAASVTAGLLSNTDYQTFTGKVSKSGDTMTGSLGIGTTSAETTLDIAGALTERAMSAPAVAPVGQGRLYFDTTANQFMVSQNGGAYTALASGGTITGVTSGAGITGGGTSGNVTVGLTNVGTAGTYTKVLTDANGRVTSGTTLTAADIPPISAGDITSGTLAAAQLPAIGTAGTYPKVVTDAYGRVTNGLALAATDLPAHSAALITSGTLAAVQLPSIGTPGTYPKVVTDAYGRVTSGTALVAGDIPALPASQITSGTFAVAQLPQIPSTLITGTLSASQLPGLSGGSINTGTLAVAFGGTGATSFTNNGLVVGGGSSPLSTIAAGTQYNILTVNAGNQPVFGALNLGSAAAVSGTLPVASGGTGSTAALSNNRLMVSSGGTIVEAPALTNGQLFVGSTGAAPTAATLAQGATQGVTFTAGAGSLTLDTAQDIRTSATPLFSSLKLTNPAVGSLVKVGTGSTLVAAAAADVTTALGYTPVNKAGDAMTGNLTTTGTVGIGTTSAETALDVAGAFTERAITAPAVAPVGQGRLYFDTTTNQFMVSENGGAYAALGVGGTISGVTAGTGLSGGGTSGSVSLALTNVGTAGTYTKVLTDANGRVTSGTTLTASDIPPISAADITSGTLAATQLPAIGTAGTYPKVVTDVYGRVTNGLALAATDLPAHSAALITSGTLAAVQLPSIGTPGTYPKVVTDAYGRVTSGTALVAGDIPSLPASQITSGTFAVAQIPQIPSTLITGTLSTSQLPGLSGGSINTGTLAVAFGGTGATSFTNNGLVVGGGSSPLSTIAAGTQYNILTVNASNQPVFGALNLGSAAAVSGTLPVASGGTGSTTALSNNRLMVSSGGTIVEAPALTNGQLFVGSTGAAPAAATLAQGATQGVTFTAGAGSLTLDTAQDIRTSATPLFSSLKLTNPAVGSLVKVGTGSTLVAAAAADVTTALGYTPVNKAGDAMTGNLTTTGTVGIGTTSASTALDVVGAFTERAITAPAVAPVGQGRLYFDTTTNQFMVSENGGAYAALGVGGTISGVTPGAGMTGGGTSGNVTVGLTNVGTAGTYTKVLTDGNGRVTSGTTLTAADIPPISAADITSGTLAATQLPTIGTAGTYPKVVTDAYGRVTNGLALAATDLPAHSAALITSGTLAPAQLPSIGTPGTYPKVVTDAYGRVTSGTALVAGDIPALPASQITSGTFAVAQIPQIPSTLITGTLSTSQLPGLSGGSINTGTLAVAFGGTGATSFTNNGLVVGGGSSPLSTIAAGTQYNILTVNASNQPVFGALNLGQTAAVTGTLPVANGGTGSGTALSNNRHMVSSGGIIVEAPALTNGQLFVGSTGAAPVAATLAQGATQGVTFTAGAGSLTLDTAQDIRTSATPLFSSLKLTNPTVGSLVKVGTGSTLVAAAAADLTGTLGYTPVNKAGDAMTGNLTTTGTFGIGTTSAETALDVAGALTERAITAPAVAPVGQGRIYFDSTLNQFMLSQNGGSYSGLAGGGTVSGVSAGTGLSGGGTSGSVTLALTSVGTPGTYTKVITDANGRVTNGTTLAATDLPTHSAALITSGTLANAQLPATPSFTNLTLSNPAAGSVVKVGTGGTLVAAAAADLTTALGYTPVNKAGDTMTGTLNLPANGFTVGTSQLLVSGGNVGIGTATPNGLLDVEGGSATGNAAGLGIYLHSQNGSGNTYNGGNIGITAGISGNAGPGGSITITSGAGSGVGATGGPLTLAAGGGPTGGAASLTGGVSSWTNIAGGAATVTGGNNTSGGGNGGLVSLTGGTGSGSGYAGGSATVAGGGGSIGGLASLSGGAASGTGAAGGAVTITGGAGGPSGGVGGAITLTAGNGNGGAGGNISLMPGTGSATGNVGIGTPSPGNKLEVDIAAQSADGIKALGSDSHYLRLLPSAGTGAYNNIVQPGDAAIVYSNGTSGTGGLSIVPWETGPSGIRMDQNGNVGIGTNSPAAALDMGSGGINLGGVIRTTWPTGSGTGFGTDKGTYAYYNGGNVGFGTNNPQSKLHLSYNGNTQNGIELTNTATNGRSWNVGDQEGNSAGQFGISDITAGGVNRLTIDSSGNIGIGTTAPAYQVDVVGSDTTGVGINMNVNNTATTGYPNAGYMMTVSGTIYGGVFGGPVSSSWGAVNGLTVGPGTSTQDIGFRVGSSLSGSGNGPAVIIKSSGNVGIGTVSPGMGLEVDASDAGWAAVFRSASTANPVVLGTVGGVGAVAGANTSFGASNLTLNPNGGNVGIGTTSPTALLQVAGQIVATLPSTMTPGGTTQTVNFQNGNLQVMNLGSATGTVTLTLSNAVAGGSYALKIIQGSTARSVTWPASVKWPGGTAITLSTTNGAVDLVALFYDGTNFYANGGNNYQ